jgi:cathepsin L
MRILSLVLCVALLAASAANATPLAEREYQSAFTSYMSKFNKEYTHDEFFSRYNTFKMNYDQIRSHNAGNHSYTKAVNQFADMTGIEFKTLMTGYTPRARDYARSLNTATFDVNTPLAASLDWRTKGAVNAVKNQQQCGSCWAFSAIAATEGAVFTKTGSLPNLSEQQLVDCSQAQGNQGCNGVLMDQAFEYIIANKGIGSEAAYPYTAVDGSCKKVSAAATISKYVDIPANNEAAMLTAANIGVLSIAIEADQSVFQFYSGGVLDSSACGTALDHGVAIVGYGTDAGKDYWIVRNSWGASWGEAGYIRMVRNKNECGLASDPSYPVA